MRRYQRSCPQVQFKFAEVLPAQGDLANDAVARDGFGQQTDHKAEHGHAAIKKLSLDKSL